MVEREALQSRFRTFILLSAFILVLETAGGIFTNSLALLSDAGHVFIDLLALLLAFFAIRLARRKSTEKFSYGYYRAEILTSAMNGIVLVFITLVIFYESYLRLLSPQPVMGPEMLAVSIVGFIANLWVVARMHGYEHESLNVRGAYLHVLGDTMSSVGVIAAGLLMMATGNYIFDPIISAMIGFIILAGSFNLIKESVHILMEATPESVKLDEVERDIRGVRCVREVHDIHVWSISSDVYTLTAHVLIDAKDIRSMNRIVSEINRMLKEKHGIAHTVIQSECGRCVEGKAAHRH